jgi:hypothetical protein
VQVGCRGDAGWLILSPDSSRLGSALLSFAFWFYPLCFRSRLGFYLIFFLSHFRQALVISLGSWQKYRPGLKTEIAPPSLYSPVVNLCPFFDM